MGIKFQSIRDNNGLRITNVEDDSHLASWLKEGDRIIKLNDTNVCSTSTAEFVKMLRELENVERVLHILTASIFNGNKIDNIYEYNRWTQIKKSEKEKQYSMSIAIAERLAKLLGSGDDGLLRKTFDALNDIENIHDVIEYLRRFEVNEDDEYQELLHGFALDFIHYKFGKYLKSNPTSRPVGLNAIIVPFIHLDVPHTQEVSNAIFIHVSD